MKITTRDLLFEAGVLDGTKHVVWSRHGTVQAAKRAARRYSRKVRAEETRTAWGAGEHQGYWRHVGDPWAAVEGCPIATD